MRRSALAAAAAAALLAAAAPESFAADVTLRDAWAQAREGRSGGAIVVGFTLVNRGGMAMLVGAESSAGATALIRSDTDGRPGGATRVVDRMMIGPGAEIEFRPGEYIVVLTDLRGAPREGDRLVLRLAFADGTVAEAEIVLAAGGA